MSEMLIRRYDVCLDHSIEMGVGGEPTKMQASTPADSYGHGSGESMMFCQ